MGGRERPISQLPGRLSTDCTRGSFYSLSHFDCLGGNCGWHVGLPVGVPLIRELLPPGDDHITIGSKVRHFFSRPVLLSGKYLQPAYVRPSERLLTSVVGEPTIVNMRRNLRRFLEQP